MNEKEYKNLLETAASNSCMECSKKEFVSAVTDAFGNTKLIEQLDGVPGVPYLCIQLSSRDDPFVRSIEWFGAGNDKGYVLVAGRMCLNSGIEEFAEILSKLKSANYTVYHDRYGAIGLTASGENTVPWKSEGE